MSNTETQVREWLDTFCTVEEMRSKPEALAKEMGAIVGVIQRDGATPQEIDAAFQHIKITTHSRAWPTVAQVYDALRATKRGATVEHVTGQKGGDKMTLSSHDLETLEGRVLPTARRWLRMYPGLRQHAIKTLEFWGDPLRDDNGKEYKSSAST